MLNAELLAILCCPETHQPLFAAGPDLIADVNRKIASGALKNRGGNLINETVDGALVREDRKYLYPIRQEIPALLIDDAIPLS